jgi:hypothetical protein
MRTKTIVTDITHKDLVNLFAAATYVSSWLVITTPQNDNTKCEKHGCIEDTWASVLLAGNPLYMDDYYAEDKNDFYGELPHEWDGRMRYTFTLEDIKKGVANALDSGEYIANYVRRWADQDCGFDNPQAEAIMQWIIFGSEIYG